MRVPVDIVTGFLGSGKTTLLRHVLSAGLGGDRVAVLVNDVADFGVDGRVLSAGRLDSVETVLELDNGCICCSLDARFELAVQDIVDNLRPDLVVIEASGVADPRLLLGKLEATMLALDAVITVVDCEGIDAALESSAAARGQVEEADFLILNKIDLVPPDVVERVAAGLLEVNPRAVQLRTAHGRVGSQPLFATSAGRHRRRATAARPHAEVDGIDSTTCAVAGPLRRAAFMDFLATLPAAVYRAKGIVHFAGEQAPSLFNFVRGRINLQWLPHGAAVGDSSQGVFIGTGMCALAGEIAERFRSCVAAPLSPD